LEKEVGKIEMNKDFKEELYKFIGFLNEGKNFSLVRLSDAEGHVLRGNDVEFDNNSIGHNWGWKRDELHFKSRELLMNASLCQEENFYIGLPTHGTKEFFNNIKLYTRQKEEFLTYACLFMDSNWKYFITDMYAEFQKKKVIGVFSENGNPSNLDLNIIKAFNIGHSAYVNNLYLINEITNYIKENNIKNNLFLVSGGPFANILIYELFKFEKENTYIDIGSGLDIKLGLGNTKGFSLNHPYYHKWFE
jgi:hypothetical protein